MITKFITISQRSRQIQFVSGHNAYIYPLSVLFLSLNCALTPTHSFSSNNNGIVYGKLSYRRHKIQNFSFQRRCELSNITLKCINIANANFCCKFEFEQMFYVWSYGYYVTGCCRATGAISFSHNRLLHLNCPPTNIISIPFILRYQQKSFIFETNPVSPSRGK